MACELARYKVDIAALSETRFREQGQLEEVGAGYTFWSGRPKAERRDADVIFVMRNDIVGRLLCMLQDISDRLMSLSTPVWGDEAPSANLNEATSNELAQRLDNFAIFAAADATDDDNASEDKRWCQLRDTVQLTALNALGRARRQHQNWFDDNDAAVSNLLAE
ncbi:hypothetical protein SprV_0401532900 [Sparganum proliferum]